jgi:hypothetical protein
VAKLKNRFVLVFGNPFIKGDATGPGLSHFLEKKGFTVIKCSAADELLFYLDRDFAILDAAKGIRKTTLFSDAESIAAGKLVSLHDFDLGFFLKLLAKTGLKKKVRIIAVPYGSRPADVEDDVAAALEKAFK